MKDCYIAETGLQLLTTFEQFKDGRSLYAINQPQNQRNTNPQQT